MPPAKKRKKQESLAPATEKSINDVTKLQGLYTAASWKQMIKYLKTNEGKEDAKRTNITVDNITHNCFLHLALKNWTAVHVTRALVEAHPEGARQRDDDGRLPLHIFVTGRGYVAQDFSSVVNALLDAYPEAAQQRDIDGKLALHHVCAISRWIDPKIVERILNLYPEGANQAVTYVDIFGSMSAYSRLKGFLPIHVACCNAFNIEAITMLTNANPQALRKRTSIAEECELGFVPLRLRVRDSWYYGGPKEKFENFTPFQWSFKTHLIYSRGNQRILEEGRPILFLLLTMTYPNICSVDRDRFYHQKARCLRKLSGKGRNGNTYSDNSFLLLHYALFCGAPLDVIETICEDKSILLEKNKDNEFPLHCALDTGNVAAAIHLQRLCHSKWGQNSPFPCFERDREGCSPPHVALTKCCPYDDRRNHLLHLMRDPKHESVGIHHKFDNGDQLMHSPLHVYLMKMMMTPDADPRQGCGGVATICPLVVQNFLRDRPSAVVTTLRCQRMRSGYKLLVAKDTDGVPLYPFQILCMLFADMFISNINFSGSRDGNNAFWEEQALSSTNSILMRQKFNEDSKVEVEQDTLESDIMVVDVLFKMLQLYPAAIASD